MTVRSDQSWLQSHPGTLAVFLMGGMVVVGAGIKFAAPVLNLFLLAAFIAIVSAPLVEWQRRFSVPRVLAVSVALLADGVVLGGLSWLVVLSVGRLTERLPEYSSLVAGSFYELVRRLQAYSPGLEASDLLSVPALMGWATTIIESVVNLVWSVALALIIAALLMFDVVRPKAVGPAGEPFRRLRRAIQEVNKYVAIKTVVSMVTGLLVGGWLYLVDAELPVLFGLLAFVLNFIPNIGSILAAIPAVSLGLLQGDAGHATMVGLGYLWINLLMGNVVEPRVMGRALGLSTSVVLLSVVLWGWLLGPIGALLSSLLTVLVKLGFSSARDLRPLAEVLGPVPESIERRGIDEDEDLAEIAVPHSPSSTREPQTPTPESQT